MSAFAGEGGAVSMRLIVGMGLCAIVASAWLGPALADPTTGASQSGSKQDTPALKTSGQGALRFRIFADQALLPEPARAVLASAHGGFAVDRRDGNGETYFALAGAGIIRISPDLKQAELLDTAAQVRDVNLHNTTIWDDGTGTSHLVFPANDAGHVFTTTLDGHLVSDLATPGPGHRFNQAAVNEYFSGGGTFVPTDVAYLNGQYFVTTGYSPLDYVLTARTENDPVRVRWGELAFGGRGRTPGTFGTGHGITVPPGEQALAIADRPHSEIDHFSAGGDYLATEPLPEGCFPCDIDYAAGYALVGCLHGPDRKLGAPIYMLKEGVVISTIMPKEDLGLTRFQHVHNAVLRQLNGRLYIIAQAWNPGDFVILEQVID